MIYVGRYGPAGTPGVAIVERGGSILFRMPGAPPITDVALEHVDGDAFKLTRGRLAGAALTFERDAGGAVIAITLGRSMPAASA